MEHERHHKSVPTLSEGCLIQRLMGYGPTPALSNFTNPVTLPGIGYSVALSKHDRHKWLAILASCRRLPWPFLNTPSRKGSFCPLCCCCLACHDTTIFTELHGLVTFRLFLSDCLSSLPLHLLLASLRSQYHGGYGDCPGCMADLLLWYWSLRCSRSLEAPFSVTCSLIT